MAWTRLPDDGCRWVPPQDIEGGPFAVLPCDVDGPPVEISEDEIRCPKCGKHTLPIASGKLLDVLEKWNETVALKRVNHA